MSEDEMRQALEAVLRGLPYLGLSSQENWECKHGFPLDECQNADCPEMLAQKAIVDARALLERSADRTSSEQK